MDRSSHRPRRHNRRPARKERRRKRPSILTLLRMLVLILGLVLQIVHGQATKPSNSRTIASDGGDRT